MSGFGFSAGDIFLGIKLLAKVGKAFQSIGGAVASYNEAAGLLQSLRTTLDCIADYSRPNDENFYAEYIGEQLDRIKPSWEALRDFLTRFEPSLGVDSKNGSMRKARKTLEYALRDLNGEVDKLQHAIAWPLQVINLFLSLLTTQSVSLDNQKQATSKQRQELMDAIHAAPMSSELQTALESLKTSQSTQLEQLTCAVKTIS